jgi:transposase
MPLWQAAEVADPGGILRFAKDVLLGFGGKSRAGGSARAGALCYCAYSGGLNAELFIKLPWWMMRHRTKPVHLVVGGLPAHNTAPVKAYVASTHGMLTLHFPPDYAPELNPDDLVWSHMKRAGVARAPLRRGETLHEKIEAQLSAMKRMPQLYGLAFLANRHSRCGHWSCP